MPTRLTKLDITEVSACRRGANPRARIVVKKADDETPGGLRQFLTALRKAFGAVQKSDGPESEAELDAALTEAEAALAAPAEGDADLDTAPEGSGAPDAATAAPDVLQAPASDPVAPTPTTQETPVPDVQKADESAVALAKAQTDAAEAIAKAAKLEQDLAEMKKAADDLRAAQAESDAATAIRKAAGAIPLEDAQVAPLAKAYAAMPADAQTALAAVLEKAAAQIAAGALYAERGSSHRVAKAGSAEDELHQKATAIQKAENVTIEKATDLALQRTPGLYARIQAESSATA